LKRRDFLASAAALSLFASEAWAAKKKEKAAKAGSGSSKPKAGGKPSKNSGRNTRGKSSHVVHPQEPVVHTAEDSVIERPPQGTSATRLPPVKAQEPPAEWRTFEITTTVTLKNKSGASKLWLPLPLNQDTLFQRTLGHSWNGNPANAGMRRLPDGDLEVFHCDWPNSSEARFALTTLVTTADRHFDVTKRTIAPEREDILRRNLQASRLIPNEGLAFQLGERIIGRIKDPVAQAKAIYDWVVDNTIYDPSLPGCGTGDVRQQLISGRYGGRSADINGLFVAICRSIGIPARCVYGLRIGPSRLFRSLGISGDDATRGHHVRAEFYIPGYGWIPVDPSDVRRAIAMEALNERNGTLVALRKVLFGVWEMNWIALNLGTDIALPGRQYPQPFLLQPQLESGNTYFDGTDSGAIQYSIRARQVEI
jgi:transglutaminase-like putative cysteine protease